MHGGKTIQLWKTHTFEIHRADSIIKSFEEQSNLYSCPCCGYLTRSENSHDTYEICSVCNWEDDPVQFNDPNFKGGAKKLAIKCAKEDEKMKEKGKDLTGLFFFGRRYYDPELGRFLTPDPLGLVEGPNLYQYLNCNPLLAYDEYGLFMVSFMARTPEQIVNSPPTPDFPRIEGAINATFGATEAFVGVGLSAVKTPSLGAFVFAHGCDRFFTGVSTVITGDPHVTLSEFALQKLGLHPTAANMANDVISIGSTIWGAAAIRAATPICSSNLKLPKTPPHSPNPLDGTKYSKKVLLQMEKNLKTGLPDFHGFPKIVDNYARYGKTVHVIGKDGLSRQKVILEGCYKGRTGLFEWIIESDQSINHEPIPIIGPPKIKSTRHSKNPSNTSFDVPT